MFLLKMEKSQVKRSQQAKRSKIPFNALPIKDKKLKVYNYIKCNKAKCAKCGDVILSSHVHDYVSCSCGAIAVDGGNEYLKRVGNMDDIIELSEYGTASEKEYKAWKKQRDILLEQHREKLRAELDKMLLSGLLFKNSFE